MALAPMDDCPHDTIAPHVDCFLLTDEATGANVAQTVHLTAKCGRCGHPFRFLGTYQPAPSNRSEVIARREPWASWDAGAVAIRCVPMEPGNELANVHAVGHG